MVLYLYRLLFNIIFIFSPLIIFIRLIKKKEDFFRFKEKFCFFTKKKIKRKLIWFHGASVGEFLSIIPLIEKLEKNKKIDQILITTSTLSSSKVFSQFKFQKTIHQFFPIDTNFMSKKFLNYWQPSLAVFIDSEIWPNMLFNIKKKSITTILLNARITNKSFKRWKIFKNFSKKVFQCFDKALSSNKETVNYLSYFGIKKIKLIGNLKFAQNKSKNINASNKLKKFLSKKIYWCASSTHPGEELICAKVHSNLKKKYTNFLSIIIPRHIHRVKDLANMFENLRLKVHCHSSTKKISNDVDIYLVDTYGETNKFFNLSKIVFVGGSLVKHGGQNPLEPTRYGCNVFHGPHTDNFKDIYKLLKNLGVAKKIASEKNLVKNIKKLIINKKKSQFISIKIKNLGNKILSLTSKEIGQVLN